MDFSKLNPNERLAVFGAIAVVVGGLVGYSYGLTVLAVLAAIAALAIVFLPQLSSSTSLPGSRGSLLLIAGGIAAVVMVLAFLMYLSVIFTAFNVRDLFFLIAVAGSILLAWAAWQELQSEGGKFQVGTAGATPSTSSSPSTASTTAPPAAGADTAAPGATTTAPPPSAVATDAPAADGLDDRPSSSADPEHRPPA